MINLTPALLKKHSKGKREINRFYVSDLWAMLTINRRTGKPYLSPQEYLQEPKLTIKEVLRMWGGTWRHKMAEELLGEEWQTEQKKEYKYNDFVLVGKADAINKESILEIKTSKELIKEAKSWHLFQLKCYLSLFQKEKGFIVQPIIKPKGLFLKVIGEAKKDEDWFNVQLEKLDKYHKQLKALNEETKTSS